MMRCKKWEVWFAKVKFEDSDIIKKRPVLIVGEKQGFIISLKMTTHYPRNNAEYTLKYWARVGLDKETTIRTSKICVLKDNDLVRKMGHLAEYDMIQIQNILM